MKIINKYIIKNKSNQLIKIIQDEINNNVVKKCYNLSGKHKGTEFVIHFAFSLGYSDINYGHFVKLKFDKLDESVTELTLIRVNGLSYIISFWGLVLFTITSLVISFVYTLHQFKINDLNEIGYNILLPLVGIIGLIIQETIVRIRVHFLAKRIEEIMVFSRIEYEKIGNDIN